MDDRAATKKWLNKITVNVLLIFELRCPKPMTVAVANFPFFATTGTTSPT